jgi:hypothetical protein
MTLSFAIVQTGSFRTVIFQSNVGMRAGAGKPRPYDQIHLAMELLRICYPTGGPIARNQL